MALYGRVAIDAAQQLRQNPPPTPENAWNNALANISANNPAREK